MCATTLCRRRMDLQDTKCGFPGGQEAAPYVLPPLSGWRRVHRFFRRPLHHQYYSLATRLQKEFPQFAFPIRLEFGAWYWATGDDLSLALIAGAFESAEMLFTRRCVLAGMTVLDIGAHHGLYTLLASKLVGKLGNVVAFEPSPRELKALRQNLALNHARNVKQVPIALGERVGEGVLYQAQGQETMCNSLRPPAICEATRPINVRVASLDRWIHENGVGVVNFVKLDVEGAELSVLRGAERLLDLRPRPIILAEVQDIRTRPWGYPAKEILLHLLDRGYKWYSVTEAGLLRPLVNMGDSVDGNYVAWPEELGRDPLMDEDRA